MGGVKVPKNINVSFEPTGSTSMDNTPTAAQAAESAREKLLSGPDLAMTKSGKFTSALDADKLGQAHIKVISIIGLNITQAQVQYISVRIISEIEQSVCYPEPTLDRVKAFKTMLRNIATDKERGKQQKDKFRTSFVSVKALFKDQENEKGGLPEPTLLKFNVLDNPRHLVHQGKLPTVDLSKYNVKVQILYGIKGEAQKLLGGVHVPFVELLHKAHTGEPLEVLFTQRQAEKSLPIDPKSPMSQGKVTWNEGEGKVKTVGSEAANMMEQNTFCYITLSAIASNDLLHEWAMLMASNN